MMIKSLGTATKLNNFLVRVKWSVTPMPKMKTKRGAAKRFTVTKGGIKCRHATRNHILTKRTTKNKRQLRAIGRIDKSDELSIKRMLCIE